MCLDDNEYFRHINKYGSEWWYGGTHKDYYVDDSYKLFDNKLSDEENQFLERIFKGHTLTEEWKSIFKHINIIFPDMMRSVDNDFDNHRYTPRTFEQKIKEIYFILQRITYEQKSIFINGINSGAIDTHYLMREYQQSGRIDIMLDTNYIEPQRRKILEIYGDTGIDVRIIPNFKTELLDRHNTDYVNYLSQNYKANELAMYREISNKFRFNREQKKEMQL